MRPTSKGYGGFEGVVTRGRGLATRQLDEHLAELRAITGESLRPGTLNVVLLRPVRLAPAEGHPFGHWGKRRIWKGRIDGVDAWFYRWRGCPLHLVEVLHRDNLRSRLQLDSGTVVHVDLPDAEAPSAWERLLWTLAWGGGRGAWYYRAPAYARVIANLDRRFATRQR